ncbi:ATP-dependent DNA helicase PcrA [subsurface metagenome]
MSKDKDSKDLSEEFIFEFYEEVEDTSVNGKELIKKYNTINFEQELNKEQLEIVNNIKGPMLVIAGAGSGKTRTIVYSVARLLLNGVRPSEIMLVTFTNKAAKEMIKRVEKLLGKRPKGIWAGTFHSMANRFIRIYTKTLSLKPNYTIMDESDANALMKLAIDKINVKEIEERFPTSKMCKKILSYSINCNKSIQEVILWKYPQFDSNKILTKLNDTFEIYKKKKAKDNLVDFDDLLVYWNLLLDERSFAQRIAKNIKYILVDEYQDTNHIQDDIIHKIASQNFENNIMAVGDDAQSIYAFRGANFHNILNFSKKLSNCKVYKITYNYRSIPEILDLANNSIQYNKKQYNKDMRATRRNGVKPYQVNVGDDEDQAKFIANQILTLRSKSFKLHEMAVLYRAGFHSMKIELELQAKNIPYEVRSGVSFFERAHIKDLIAHLRIIENPYDELSWSRIFSMIPGFGTTSGSKIFSAISQTEHPIEAILNKTYFSAKLKGQRIPKDGLRNLRVHIKQLITLSRDESPSEVILNLTELLEDPLKSKYADWYDRLDDLKQLSIYATDFKTIQQFLEQMSLNVSELDSRTTLLGSKKTDEKPLILSTIHRAKGLEWRIVFIPMLSEDYFPSHRVVGDEGALEEERRVFYVAMTRAKDQLFLISPSVISGFKGKKPVGLSQFVSELNPKYYLKSKVRFKSTPIEYETRKKKGKRYYDTSTSFISADTLLKDNKRKKPENV